MWLIFFRNFKSLNLVNIKMVRVYKALKASFHQGIKLLNWLNKRNKWSKTFYAREIFVITLLISLLTLLLVFLIQEEFLIVSKRSFYVNVPNGNIPLQRKEKDQGSLEP